MNITISIAPCCWGVDDVDNPYLPKWQTVLSEASQAGYKGIELGPYGYLPLDLAVIKPALQAADLNVVAGTIFDDLTSLTNQDRLIQQTHDICSALIQLPPLEKAKNQHFPAPYLVVIDHVHKARSLTAGQPGKAPRLSDYKWNSMMDNIRAISEIAQKEYGIRPVIHPHAGGYIEFDDEIRRLLEDISYEEAGLCLDTGHLYYAKMDPVTWIQEHQHRVDYIHFKDIDLEVYQSVMNDPVDFFEACAKGVMCSIGKGCLDYDGLFRMLQEIDYQGYITIEQERDPRHTETSLRDVSDSLQYLTSRGF